ncbi:hypothetical protein B4U79_16475 [Dinothrombium tinctorium]|uniref:Ubiquitin-like domain-containing protein n=1 Tax=Dinothrombium tinctorium TaxID=1965070 RepID=A0A443QLA6_9ACAR|nr:hypothetical protein B4U79_16475 [Dinothrombium tinctorium]
MCSQQTFVEQLIAADVDSHQKAVPFLFAGDEQQSEDEVEAMRRKDFCDYYVNDRFNDEQMAFRHSEKSKYFYHNNKVYERSKHRSRGESSEFRQYDSRGKYFAGDQSRNSSNDLVAGMSTGVGNGEFRRTKESGRIKDNDERGGERYRSGKDYRRSNDYRYGEKSKEYTELDFRSHSSQLRNYYYSEEDSYGSKRESKNNHQSDLSLLGRDFAYHEQENQISHYDYGGAKTMYHSVRSSEESMNDLCDNRDPYYTPNSGTFTSLDSSHQSLNLSPISSTSSAVAQCLPFFNQESSATTRDYFAGNDVDLRRVPNESQTLMHSHEIGTEIRCQYQSLGCRVVAKFDLITSHEEQCAFNPKNVKSVCKSCKLLVSLKHNCLSELREELDYVKSRTDWIRYTNSSRLTSSQQQQQQEKEEEGTNYIWVHFYGEKEEKFAKFKVTNTDDSRSILKRSLQHLGIESTLHCKNESFEDNEPSTNYQLVFTTFHVFSNEATIDSFKFTFPNEPHFIVIPKTIQVKVTARKLQYYDNEHVMVCVPSSVPFDIDPNTSIMELKQVIAAKIPVDWTRHDIEHCGRRLYDFMTIYVIGILDGDTLEVIAK